MAIKKTELYRSLWASCDELRGGMDASQYKDYVLTLLFMKYISDKYAGKKDAMLIVPEGGSFDDMLALGGDKEIGDKINKIISNLAEENGLKGVIDVADFNDDDKLGQGQAKVDRLTKLVKIFGNMNLSANRAAGDDLLGDAYEYLMRHFATESGKSKGQFYTPAEVSRVLAKVVGITDRTSQDQAVYDPTCGSGSLLLKVADEAPRGLSIFGQENDNATWALARMNMILHDNTGAEIWKGNTLSDPYWKNKNGGLETFDFAVANPPFSYKSWSNGVNLTADPYKRFEYGTPPEKNGDYAFLLHIVKSLKSTGKAAVILPHGVLFRGNKEADIRRNLLKQGYIKGIIGLPANLFYGTGIPACIVVIDKAKSKERQSIFMIDASRGFMKDGNKNRLRSQDIHKIVDVFNRQFKLDRYSRMVSLEEIEKNDYNLNIPRYIDSSEPEDLHDLSGHLQGGIPDRDIDGLDDYWQVFPTLRNTLFKPGSRDGYSDCLVESSQVKAKILGHPEFAAFSDKAMDIYRAWKDGHESRLKGIDIGDEPKALIHELSEDLLDSFCKADLLDKYNIYQILMDYWAETMQDDVYILVQDGWQAGSVLRQLVVKKGEKLKETPDLIIGKKKYKTELIPPALIVARYFSEEQAEIDHFQAELDSISQKLEAYTEEHSGEDGPLEEAKNDNNKVTKATVTARLKEIKGRPEFLEEQRVLDECLSFFNQEAAAKKAIKDAQAALDEAVFAKYPKLSEEEVQFLVVEDKWLDTLQSSIQAEIERVTQEMANRVKTLEERYTEPLPRLIDDVDTLSGKVDEHLRKMGLAW